MIRMIGEVRYDPKTGKYRGHLAANNGEATVVLFTCVASRLNNAQVMIDGYARGMVKGNGNRADAVAWMKEWEVEPA